MSKNNMEKDSVTNQIACLLNEYNVLKSESKRPGLGDIPLLRRQALVSKAISLIYRVSGLTSTHSKEVQNICEITPLIVYRLELVIGILEALKYEVENGYLASLEESIHGNIFSDYLDMADNLLELEEKRFKDPAAVIIGSTLECHLKELCKKNDIPTEEEKDGKMRQIKADRLNAELAKRKKYQANEQKQITAWLGIRNDAAHGDYDKYSKEQVVLMVAGIRDFIARNPA